MELYSLLINGLFGLSFNADPSATREEVRAIADAISAASRPAPGLRREANDITAEAIVAPGKAGRAEGLRLLKCDHNHVSEFTLGGVAYVHKIYGNPGRWTRECVASGYAHEVGLGGVGAPVLAECFDGPAGPVFYAVFRKNREGTLFAACDGITGAQRSQVFRNLGRWARAYHDSLSRLPRPAARRRFCVTEKCLFDVGPLLRRGLFDERDCAAVEEISNQYLALLGDDGSALIHNDLGTFTNFFVDIPAGGRIAQVIDHEFTHVGFRSTELLWVYIEAARHFEDFVEGYGRRWPVSPLPLLELWASLFRVVDAAGYDWRERPPCRCPRRAAEAVQVGAPPEVLERALDEYRAVLDGMVARC